MPMLLIGALAVMVPQWAMATGTAANTTISNTVAVNYKVNSVDQTEVTDTVTFKVDNKVNLTVLTQDTTVTILPGQQKSFKFKLTNTGNATQDYVLSAIADPSNNFTPSAGPALYSDATCTTSITNNYITNIAVDTPTYIYICITAPNTAANGKWANYALKANTHDANKTFATKVETTVAGGGAAGSGTAVVLADVDADGAGANDGDKDGDHLDWGGSRLPNGSTPDKGFKVESAALTVAKSTAVYWDPINLTSTPKAIPGAIVTYTITITNSGAQSATNVAISDDLNTEVTGATPHLAFGNNDTNSSPDGGFKDATKDCAAGEGIVVTDGTSGATAACETNAYSANNDGTTWNDAGGGATYGATNKVVVTGLTVDAGESATVKFQVTIQ